MVVFNWLGGDRRRQLSSHQRLQEQSSNTVRLLPATPIRGKLNKAFADLYGPIPTQREAHRESRPNDTRRNYAADHFSASAQVQLFCGPSRVCFARSLARRPRSFHDMGEATRRGLVESE